MNEVHCPVCNRALSVRPAKGRKSGKLFISMVCPGDGRHFRGFIADQQFVHAVIEQVGLPVDGAGSPSTGPGATGG